MERNIYLISLNFIIMEYEHYGDLQVTLSLPLVAKNIFKLLEAGVLTQPPSFSTCYYLLRLSINILILTRKTYWFMCLLTFTKNVLTSFWSHLHKL